MLRRFRPYLGYLRPVRVVLVSAIIAGIIQGVTSGAGLPLMVKYVFPRVFSADRAVLSAWQIAAVVMWLPIVFTVRGAAGYASS